MHRHLKVSVTEMARRFMQAARLMVDLEKAWDEIEAAADRGLTCIDVLVRWPLTRLHLQLSSEMLLFC